ncbi:MAG: hypothetical protein AB7F19_07305 [Candidatus Babeliales bacterium]
MKKIFSHIASILLAVPLGIMLLFSSITFAATEAENLDAWAKMYEDMNQASGGEIEKLMKEMEQSGELDVLMKELEQSGELDNIIDAMIKSTPQEFMQNLEQEIEKERAAMPAPAPEEEAPAPLVATKPSTPMTPIMQVDKSKLKQVQALLGSIVSKIASLRQKAATRTAVQRELNPWEYILNDIAYYLTTIQDENLAKYIQQPEFASFYDHLVSLNASLSVDEPRVQVEEMLDIDFVDPYQILGFATSNISKAEVDKRYTELATQKNPFAIKDKLKRQGLAPAELEAQFKIAQQDYNEIFDAYKRIEQKETSAQAFLALLQALHTAVYKHMIIEDAKKLLRQFDPEALKLKEAQEAKEKEARDYRAKVASQPIQFLPPIFDWPSFGDRRTDRETSAKTPGLGWEKREYPDFDREAGRMQPLTADQAKGKDKGKDGKDKKDGAGKKDDKSKDGKDKKDGDKDKKKDEAKEAKLSADMLAPKLKPEFEALKATAVATGVAVNGLFPSPAIGVVQADGVNIGHMTATTKKAADITTKIAKDIEALGKLKDDKDKELKKYYDSIEKSFNEIILNDAQLKRHLEKLFAHTDTKIAPAGFTDAQKNAYFGVGAGANKNNIIENLQSELTRLAYAVTDSEPSAVKKTLTKATDIALTNKSLLGTIRAPGGIITPKTGAVIDDMAKGLEETVKRIEDNTKKPAVKLVLPRYNKDVKKVIVDQLVTGDANVVFADLVELDTPNPLRRSQGGQPGIPLPISNADKEKIKKLTKAYTKLGEIAQSM